MKNCLHCQKLTKNAKFCSISCQNSHQNKYKNDKKFGIIREFNVKCIKCNKDFTVNEREKLHPQRSKYYCNRTCANTHKLTDKTKAKISHSLFEFNKTRIIKPKIMVDIICKICGIKFNVPRENNRKVCSKKCASICGGRKSVNSQNRRSKNEVYFAELCKNKFTNVLTNEPVFNGWDADIILLDQKIAVLWNGKWHYEKIKEKHSLIQVQNRDRIKIKEIEKANYKPYIVKDMGKENKKFVEEQFGLFLSKI